MLGFANRLQWGAGFGLVLLARLLGPAGATATTATTITVTIAIMIIIMIVIIT